MESFGLKIENKNEESNSAWCGVLSKKADGKILITNVYKNSPAVEAGLSVNDEIISVNGWRLNDKLETSINEFKVAQEITVMYSRDSKIRNTILTLVSSPMVDYYLSIENGDNGELKRWLRH